MTTSRVRNSQFRSVEIAGVGNTTFGKHLDRSIGSLAAEAVESAILDAKIRGQDVEAVFFSNAASGLITGQEMIRGQVALKGTELAGLPIVNTENACASGGTAAHLAWLSVASGLSDIAIAIGAEKLFHADKRRSFAAIESGTDLSLSMPAGVQGSVMMGAYAEEARAYSEAHGDVTDALAAIAVKNRHFASLNSAAQFQKPITREDVQESRLVADPLRLLTCSPLTDGAAAIVFRAASESPVIRANPRVLIAASALCSYQTGNSVVERAASQAYNLSGLSAPKVDVFQLHDACAFAELIQYEQVGIAQPGYGAKAALNGVTGADGQFPVNTDGGLLSRGHALGATGLAQLIELTRQLRGTAGPRQLVQAETALAVNSGGWMGDDYAASVATLLVSD